MAHLHPMLIHFPIALLLFGVLVDIVRKAGWSQNASLSTVGLWCTTFGLVMMLPAIGSGLLAHTFQAAPSEGVQDLINLHERFSYLELVLFGVLVAWRWDAHGDDRSIMPTGYIVAAIVGVSLLVASSFIGGMLVFQHGMGVVSDGGSSQVPTATDTP